MEKQNPSPPPPPSPPLPTDVMEEICCRLPAKSVARFRSVSKLYNSLLSQPFFIKKHLPHRSLKLLVHLTNYEYLRSYKRMEEEGEEGITRWLLYYPFSSFSDNSTIDTSELKHSFYKDPGDLSIMGSSNGLFCIQNTYGPLMLWNPTTMEIACLPRLPTLLNCYEEKSINYRYGFGYDSFNDDYKIVCIMSVTLDKRGICNMPDTTKTCIYSHKTGSWKEAQPFPLYKISGDHIFCQFVHDKFHWVAERFRVDNHGSRDIEELIVSLDLTTERFEIVPQPSYHIKYPDTDIVVNVGVLRGELCFYINFYHGNDTGHGFHLWMMREYGVEQSWYQVLTIHNLESSIARGVPLFVPLFMMKNGEILLQEYGASIYLYNPKTCEFRTVRSCSLDDEHDIVTGYIFVESLVSPFVKKKDNKLPN